MLRNNKSAFPALISSAVQAHVLTLRFMRHIKIKTIRSLRKYLQYFAALFLSLSLVLQPASAQSILRDAETEALLQDMAAPLVKAAGLKAGNVEVILIHDRRINAFVAGGQTVYLNSGLIETADTANEVQGVIAHELGHIAGGHIIRFNEGIKTATGITILSLVLGAAAIAAGAGEAGAGILAAGQQAARSKFLAFSRVQERSADAAGVQYLASAGITGKGSIDFFKKLQNLEFRLAIPQDDSYGRTHPLSGERISVLYDSYVNDPAWETPLDKEIEARFQRVKAKLKGFTADPKETLRDYPERDQTIPARYARAYAWHKGAYPERALFETDALIQKQPTNPYFLELRGQILLESGRPTEALAPLRKAVELTNNQPLIAAIFGHSLIATEDEKHFEEATRVLKAAVVKDNRNPFAWYQLGVVYDRQGDEPRASLASAERHLLRREPARAVRSASVAMAGLPRGSPDWIRAQDIFLISKAATEKNKKRKKKRK